MIRGLLPFHVAAFATLLAVSGCSGCRETGGGAGGTGSTTPRSVALGTLGPAGEKVTRVKTLAQGWSDADAEWFYHVPQGSQLVPYDWFLHLEKPGGGPFRAAEHIASLGYIPRERSTANPDALPIGFTKEQGSSGPWLGLTCAACHTTQINYGETAWLVDGGPSMGDFERFTRTLTTALEETADPNDEGRFDRFATAVLGENASENDRTRLREGLARVIDLRKAYDERNLPSDPAHAFGFARVDAFGAILNELSVRFLDIRRNHAPADAPVSYPFLWDTPHHDFVQWNGVAPNAGLGALGRNVGEVVGVFGAVTIPEEPPLAGYATTIEIRNLRDVESRLKKLTSPKWPTEIATIDERLATAGRTHFVTYCQRCHEDIDRDARDRKVVARMSATGTDPKMGLNFAKRKALTGRLKGTRRNFNPIGEKFGDEAAAEDLLVHAVVGAILGGWKEAPRDPLHDLRYRERPGVVAHAADDLGPEYKARPLNGIWATAPYLHNGSVPTLKQLLLPAAERDDVFWVGRREFDPADVGFRAEEGPGLFRFDASLPGNSNEGHEYGVGVPAPRGDGLPALGDRQRGELLEYLKTL